MVCVHENAMEFGREETSVFDLSDIENRKTSCHVGDGRGVDGDE